MKRAFSALIITLSFLGLSYTKSAAEDSGPKAPAAREPKAPISARLSEKESEVLSRLHAANQKEIGAGALAVERGQTGEVRRYGQHLVDEHTAADRKVKHLAKRKNVKLNDSESAVLENLRATPEAEFDRVFISTMIKEHDAAIELVRDAQEDCEDRDVLEFLNATLPVLQKHRDMAEKIADKAKS